MTQLYLNGRFMPPEQATLSVMDRGFLFADGVYEVIPVYGGVPRRASEHLRRLASSLHGIGLPPPLTDAKWSAVFQRLLESTALAESNSASAVDQTIYVQVTRGAAPTRDHRFPKQVEPTVLAMVNRLKPRASSLAEQGVAAVLRDDFRWGRCDIKSVALLAAVLLRQDAHESAAEEAILVRDGLVVEGSTSNLFIVSQGRLITPPASRFLLSGITRALTLELARQDGIDCAESDVSVDTLRAADEIWLTSSTREVMPVTRLDGACVGAGVPGPLWRRVDARYQDYKTQLRERRV
ncbi:MAG: D-amino acid aminotransferase [Thiohalocapsa sp.]